MSEPSPTLRLRLKELIVDSLNQHYISQSSKDGIPTGNHYQSVRLGDHHTQGFRTPRSAFLDQIAFAEKKVLDLGSNLGEISRGARARGACLVDGFELDPYFIEIANAVNAYNNVTRVSFYEKDIGDAASYTDHYDILLAFSVFPFIRPILDQLHRVTDDLLIIETHKLEGNLESQYLQKIIPYFPHYRLLGMSDWGVRHDDADKRAVVAFAKEEGVIETYCGQHESVTADDYGGMRLELDVGRTRLFERFFSLFSGTYGDALVEAAESVDIDIGKISRLTDSRFYDYRNWMYWLLYLKGYAEYRRSGSVRRDNTYFRFLTSLFLPNATDLELVRVLAREGDVLERMGSRFHDLDLAAAAADSVACESFAPVRLIRDSEGHPHPLRLYIVGEEVPIEVDRVDGWHRVFGAQVFRVQRLTCEVAKSGE
jgi:hypothetical protein